VRFPASHPLVVVKCVLPALGRVVGAQNVTSGPAAMAVEDFAYFSQTAPGFFFLPDTQKPGATSGIKHELPNFQANDSAIPIGMRAMTEVLLKHLAPPEETKRNARV